MVGSKMWSVFIEILDQKDAVHSDLAHLAISLINKVILTLCVLNANFADGNLQLSVGIGLLQGSVVTQTTLGGLTI